jgi:type II secretory pathway pseudopilin PulG
MQHKTNTTYRGSLLIEILIAISILAIVLVVSSQALFVNLRSNKSSSETDTASALAVESLEAIRSVADEKWQNIYYLSKGIPNYYVSATSTSNWVVATGTEVISLNSVNYTRVISISNVSRDQTPGSRLIESSYNAANDDPSTQLVTVDVTWPNGSYTINQYLYRWKNSVCAQTDWLASGSTGVKTCPDTTYATSSNLGTPGATLQIQ